MDEKEEAARTADRITADIFFALCFMVMGILPGILLLGDTIIDRTTFNIKYPAIVQTTEAVGMVRLDGRIRGTVSGKIDAEVHGVLMGDVSAVISAGNPDAVQFFEKAAKSPALEIWTVSPSA